MWSPVLQGINENRGGASPCLKDRDLFHGAMWNSQLFIEPLRGLATETRLLRVRLLPVDEADLGNDVHVRIVQHLKESTIPFTFTDGSWTAETVVNQHPSQVTVAFSYGHGTDLEIKPSGWEVDFRTTNAFPHNTEIPTPIDEEPMDGIENDGRWVVTRGGIEDGTMNEVRCGQS